MKKENYITAIKLALVVGTILNLINNYDVFLNSNWSLAAISKMMLTYSVPFFVSIYSSWKAEIRRE